MPEEGRRMPSARAYIVVATLGIVFAYVGLGGADWGPLAWAAFCVFAVSIVIINVMHDADRISADQYERFERTIFGVSIAAVAISGVWRQSFVALGLALVLALLWLDDLRVERNARARNASLGPNERR